MSSTTPTLHHGAAALTEAAPMTAELRDALSRPFGREMIRIKRVPKRPDMDYISHGAVTKRLNEVYPAWHAEMIERWVVEQGGQLHCLGGVMRLTIGGVTREEAGGPSQFRTLADDLKNTYSDCLKRCAMRFGVALEMWESAEEGDEDAMPYVQGAEGVGPPASAFRPPPAQRPTDPQANGSAPARVSAPPTAQSAPQPLTTKQFDAAIAEAWMAFHAGKIYETAVMGLNDVRPRFTAAQKASALDDVAKLREAYRDRDAALAPPAEVR